MLAARVQQRENLCAHARNKTPSQQHNLTEQKVQVDIMRIPMDTILIPENQKLDVVDLAALARMVPETITQKAPEFVAPTGRKKSEPDVDTLYPKPFAGLTPPTSLRKSIVIGEHPFPQPDGSVVKGVLHLAGKGAKPADIMFVSPSAFQEEVYQNKYGGQPGMLKGPAANLFLRELSRHGFTERDWYYTALCKYAVPKAKPNAADIRWNMPAFEAELKAVKPKIVVCLGKIPFDLMVGRKFNLRDVQGGFLRSEKWDCLVYVMDTLLTPLMKPENLERFGVDLREIQRTLKEIRGVKVAKVETNYSVISKADELYNLMEEFKARQTKQLSTDCEWHGDTYVDGRLRSIQFSWRQGYAAYVRLMDDKLNYAFSHPLETVREIMNPVLNNPELRFIGHNFAADAVWMQHHLGIDTYKRCSFDTMFAQKCVNEYADLKLERNAVRYTDMGRYDLELNLWKKDNKFDESAESGYGLIPDHILIPYACLRGDSLVQLADGSWQQIRKLVKQKYDGYVRSFDGTKVVNARVTNWHRADVRQKEWFKLKTSTTTSCRWGTLVGPSFTPDHKILTQRGKVRVDALVPGLDKILTTHTELSPEQLSVLLGSLLGDGGFSRKNGKGVGFRFSQRPDKADYADWKAQTLAALEPGLVSNPSGFRSYTTPFSSYIAHLDATWPTHPLGKHSKRKAVLTSKLLSTMGDLGLAVWYMDDGTLANDKRGSYRSSRIYCRIPPEEQEIAVTWLTEQFGDGVSYNRNNYFIQFVREAHANFHQRIDKLIHPVMAYKAVFPVNSTPLVVEAGVTPFYDIIVDVVPSHPIPTKRGCGVRYCLSVAGTENFLTSVGFVSDCRDVDAPLCKIPPLVQKVADQGLLPYYLDIMLLAPNLLRLKFLPLGSIRSFAIILPGAWATRMEFQKRQRTMS